jgi:hypothetical protein
MTQRATVVSVAVCGLLFSGCLASFQSALARTGEGISRDVTRALSPLEEFERRRRLCGNIRAETVAFAEEKTLGDAMGVKVTAAKGGLALTYTQSAGTQPQGQVALASPDAVNARARTVAVVGAGLARHGGRPELPWRFGVLASDEVNAVSTPGGLVMVAILVVVSAVLPVTVAWVIVTALNIGSRCWRVICMRRSRMFAATWSKA